MLRLETGLEFIDHQKQILMAFSFEIAPKIRYIAEKTWVPPQVISDYIKRLLSRESIFADYKQVLASGETDNISIYLIGKDSVIIYTPFMNMQNNIIFTKAVPKVLMKLNDNLYLVEKNKKIIDRLNLPKVVLINPSVKDVFPIPRLALCVASLAGYLRKYQKAEVYILDMQIGPTTETIMDEIRRIQPHIIGISISFGQLNLAISILKKIFSDEEIMVRKPLIVAGNVISAFGYEGLINRFPGLIICNGEGELSLTGLVEYVKGKITLESVPGITYLKEGTFKRTPTVELSMDDLPLPAMDTIEGIIQNNGALTMEISRGCSHSACSFCPRTHKPRKWKGMSANSVLKQLRYCKRVFDSFGIERRIFMADEEFVGWMQDGNAAKRIIDIMSGMICRGFNIRFETNTRIDQIYNPRKDKLWHIERMKMLTHCRKAGLDRLLVGVESGSDSVLKRFNKKIRSYDSVIALRILTALDIGTRITFINFDPLMNFSELKENIAFLERRDVYLKPIDISRTSYSDLFDGVHEANFVKANSSDTPFYEYVSYMLVSLEVLMNSDYVESLIRAETELELELFLDGRKPDINMARYKAAYMDRTIGDIAIASQKWIDRHFALDYCLKGIYKTAIDDERKTIFGFRARYRQISFSLLKSLVWIFDKENTLNITNDALVDTSELAKLREGVRKKERSEIILRVLDLFNEKMRPVVDDLEKTISAGKIRDDNGNLLEVVNQWLKSSEWSLINP